MRQREGTDEETERQTVEEISRGTDRRDIQTKR